MSDSPNRLDWSRVTRLWKTLEIGAAVVAVAIWIAAMALWIRYDSTRPRNPDPGTSRVHRLNTHGSIVYLTHGEDYFLRTLMLMGGVSFVAAVCIDIFKKPFRQTP
jgi:hypothetical protein